MAEPGERQRTVLRAPRVEFDLSALVLGALGWLAYQWIWPALASLLSVPEGRVRPWDALRNEFFGRLLNWLGLPYTDHIGALVGARWPMRLPPEKEGDKFTDYALDLPVWKLAVVGVFLLVLWSVVAGAISRVYAVRFARDESIGAGDGLAFSFGNLKAFLMAPLFVATAAALCLGVAALAGAGSAIPGAGPFLQIVLHPLAIVASLLALVLAIGGVFGLPMTQAALATERNGFLDAVSRTYSYVFTRPVSYVVCVGIVTGVAGVIAAFGNAFQLMTLRAMTFGASWAADSTAPIDAPRALFGGIAFGVTPEAALGWPQVEKVSGLPLVWIYVAWAFSVLTAAIVNGFVLSYFVGGLTDTYFLLRRDVDGIDDSEVFVEGAHAKLSDPLPDEPARPADKA